MTLLTSSTDPGALNPIRIVVHDINSSSLLGDALLHVKLLFVADVGDVYADVVGVADAALVVPLPGAAAAADAGAAAASFPDDILEEVVRADDDDEGGGGVFFFIGESTAREA